MSVSVGAKFDSNRFCLMFSSFGFFLQFFLMLCKRAKIDPRVKILSHQDFRSIVHQIIGPLVLLFLFCFVFTHKLGRMVWAQNQLDILTCAMGSMGEKKGFKGAADIHSLSTGWLLPEPFVDVKVQLYT